MAEVVVTRLFPVREAISFMDHRATIHRPFHPDPPLPAREAAIPITFHRLDLATIHRVDLKVEALAVPILTDLQAHLLLLVRPTQVLAALDLVREDQGPIHLKDIQVLVAQDQAAHKVSVLAPTVADPVPVSSFSAHNIDPQF